MVALLPIAVYAAELTSHVRLAALGVAVGIAVNGTAWFGIYDCFAEKGRKVDIHL